MAGVVGTPRPRRQWSLVSVGPGLRSPDNHQHTRDAGHTPSAPWWVSLSNPEIASGRRIADCRLPIANPTDPASVPSWQSAIGRLAIPISGFEGSLRLWLSGAFRFGILGGRGEGAAAPVVGSAVSSTGAANLGERRAVCPVSEGESLAALAGRGRRAGGPGLWARVYSSQGDLGLRALARPGRADGESLPAHEVRTLPRPHVPPTAWIDGEGSSAVERGTRSIHPCPLAGRRSVVNIQDVEVAGSSPALPPSASRSVGVLNRKLERPGASPCSPNFAPHRAGARVVVPPRAGDLRSSFDSIDGEGSSVGEHDRLFNTLLPGGEPKRGRYHS